MDDVSRAYFEMYGYTVANEMVSHDGEVKYQLMKEEVDTEAIKARIHKTGKEASNPEHTRKDVEKLHDKRRKEINKLLRREETRSDISLARSAVSAARKRAKENPGIHKGDDTEFEHKLNKKAFKNLVKQEREKRSLAKEDLDTEIDEGYVSMQGKPLKRVMTKVRDLSSDSQMIKSNPDYKRQAKRTGATDQDIKKAASKLEDRADKIISRISKHDPELAKERESQNRKTISVRATPVINKRIKEDVIKEVKTTYLPKSRERDIGKHDDWKDPHPDTRDWGEKSPKGKKLVRRAVAVIGTQRRQDKEVGLRKEEMELIISYLLENGYADNEKSAHNIMEAMSENWLATILDETLS